MRRWHRMAIYSLQFVDWFLRNIRRFMRWLLGKNKNIPLHIDGYWGYAHRDFAFLKGRVLMDKKIQPKDEDSKFRNFVNTFKRFASDEIPHAELRVEIQDNHFQLTASEKGYFTLESELPTPLQLPVSGQVCEARITLEKAKYLQGEAPQTTIPLLFPGPGTPFGVISDVDDTILQSYITSPLKLRAFYATFFHNAATRKEVAGAAAFFQELKERANKAIPFFYVSNSPWNLYDLLLNFLEKNKFPVGPILLREIKSSTRKIANHAKGHKYRAIVKLLTAYPDMPFILIGDSGEKDAEIYRSIDHQFPGRIRAIIIREVARRRTSINKKLYQKLEDDPKVIWLTAFTENHPVWENLNIPDFSKMS
ncbi:MAG: DUF2183 domain-containing protein [Phaeodactylibacter sp.]|nr:DUF2183 domain-containing protein [Phaeodactylibacter sp.]